MNGTETGLGFLCGLCTVKQHAGSKDKNIFKKFHENRVCKWLNVPLTST